MRLLKRETSGEFSLKVFDDPSKRPRYAILSHTWGKVDSEVTLDDIKAGTARNKRGYKKLEFCADRAEMKEIEYFWVDTCCIDQRNFTEVGAAINSMFRWYQKSEVCFVYLSGVTVLTEDRRAEHFDRDSAIRNCRWFTRGWTLQELIAPSFVEFYSQDNVRLGDRLSLESLIVEITRIPQEALQGTRPLSDFDVEERFSWVENRKTTIAADKAHCLLGIFNIQMSLIYSESQDGEEAMARLRRKIKKSQQTGLSSIGKVLSLYHRMWLMCSCGMKKLSDQGWTTYFYLNRIHQKSQHVFFVAKKGLYWPTRYSIKHWSKTQIAWYFG
jgi:hypothetical protein